jgi:aerobic carbon-monoxide dehydrogenase medium subunit
MYPPAFEYKAPAEIGEVLELLAKYGEDAKILAGGQSLLPLLKMRLLRPDVVVDINRLPGLDQVREDETGITIGSLVRHAQIARDPVLGRHLPWLREVVPLVADRQVRSLGTIAGTLVEADPAGDWSAVFLALDAEVRVVGPAGPRTVRCRDWFTASFTPAIAPEELIMGVRVPRPGRGTAGAYVKIEKRVGDFAVAGCAVVVRRGRTGQGSVGVGMTGVGPVPMVPAEAVTILERDGWDPGGIQSAAAAVAAEVSPLDDMRGSATYKKRMAGVAFQRAMLRAAETQGGSA